MKQLTKITKYKHSANAGDLIASLAGVKQLAHDKNKKANYYQKIGQEAQYYQGAVHPTKNDKGVEVSMNDHMFDMLKPLIEAQPYINSFEKYEGQDIDINLDDIRRYRVNMPFGSIQRWYFYVYPQLACDLSKKWIFNTDYDESYKDTIIINRTQRYRNPQLNYFFLKDYQDKLLFTGTKHEHELFCQEWKLDIPYLKINNFLELTNILASCKFFIGNQSFVYNISEAMKIPRILELCDFAPNCIPYGKNGYDFYHQPSLEYYFKKLNKQQ